MKRGLLEIFVVLIMVGSIFNGGGIKGENDRISFYKNEVKFAAEKINYEPHDPIRIDDNASFAEYAAEERWPGNGSKNNPYIIEGYEIDGGGYGYCIYIGNTSCHFEIRNCKLYNASGSGLILHNVGTGKINSTTIFLNRRHGIYLEFSSNITIFFNNVLENNDEGIYLCNSTNNFVENNIITSNHNGIRLLFSNFNNILNNAANNNSKYGFLLGRSKYNILKNNTAFYNEDGFRIQNATFNKIDNNTAFLNGDGICLHSSSNNKLSNNTCTNNSHGGVRVRFSIKNFLGNNTIFLNNNFGILIDSSSNNTIVNNTIYSNKINGIYIFSPPFKKASTNNTITTNYILHNGEEYGCGILVLSSHNKIFNNYFNNTINAYALGYNIWNTTKKPGKSIANGRYLGGNYWDDYDGIDTNGDGIGDTSVYIISRLGKNVDELPLLNYENTKPQADFWISPEDPEPGQPIKFIDNSIDLDGNIDESSYFWDFGDGSISYEKNPIHTYEKWGTYNVTHSVKDEVGAEGRIVKPISVGTIRVEIEEPKNWIYLFDRKILPWPNVPIGEFTIGAIVIGKITIEARATAKGGVEKVEFYYAGELKFTDTTFPYEFELNEYDMGIRSVEVRAYGKTGSAYDEVWILIYNPWGS